MCVAMCRSVLPDLFDHQASGMVRAGGVVWLNAGCPQLESQSERTFRVPHMSVL